MSAFFRHALPGLLAAVGFSLGLTGAAVAQGELPAVSVEPPATPKIVVTRCSDPANATHPDCVKAAPKIRAQKKSAKRTRSVATAPAKSVIEQIADNVVASGGNAHGVWGFAEQELVMYAGEVIVLNVGVVDRVAIGNGKIASSSVVDKSRLLIIAQDVGDTNILLWDKTKPIKDIRLRVTAQNLSRVKREVVNLLAEIPGLKIANVGDRIFIEGYDLTEADLSRVKALASQYPNIIDRTVAKSRPPKPADPSTMIMFDLYFVEFKKSFLQNLGVSWQRSFNGFNVGLFGEATRGPLTLRPGIGGQSGTTFEPPLPNQRINGLSAAANVAISVPATINLAVDSGDAILLAAPKIASRSGGKAKFTAGGEIPLPSTSQNGTNVTFKSYGILLEVEPQINADGTVSGVVRAEVSAIDPAITVLGIPGFLTRRTEADFYSKSGQAVVLSGLYSQEISKDTQKVPFFGDIPLLKALFSSNAENRKSSELVVFIVPNLHSSETAANEKTLTSTKAALDEQSRHLLGGDGDFLPKLRPSSQLWSSELQVAPRAAPEPEKRVAPVEPWN